MKITPEQLPLMFMVTGLAALIAMPVIGQWSDKFNKFKLFSIATLLTILIVNVYAHYSETAFHIVVITNVLMMIALTSRMIPSSALTSSIPQPQDRGAFMSMTSSLQQIAGGFGAMIGGLIIVQKDRYAPLEHYDILALVASGIMIFTIYLMYQVSQMVAKK